MNADRFFDELAEEYHKLLDDWFGATLKHAVVIDHLLMSAIKNKASAIIVDVACGIGTQALGLARLGWRVMASDVSSKAVVRARNEAIARDINISYSIADMRHIGAREKSLDAVICFDNPLAYLTSVDDIARASQAAHNALRSGGIYLASLRDYDFIHRSAATGQVSPVDDYGRRAVVNSWYSALPNASVPAISSHGNTRAISFQVWHWADDAENMEMELFLLSESSGGWSTSTYRTPMRAWRQETLTEIFIACGFESARWLPIESTGYYEPIFMAVSG